jgi:hypothetical protein
LPGEVAGAVFTAVCSVLLFVSLPNTDLHSYTFISHKCLNMPIPAAALSEVWVGGRSLAGISGSNSAGGMGSAIVMYNYARVHDILDGTWRCQGFIFPLDLYFWIL